MESLHDRPRETSDGGHVSARWEAADAVVCPELVSASRGNATRHRRVHLHGKLWWNENDLRTFRVLNVPVVSVEQIDRRQTPQETRDLLWRELGNVLAHGGTQWYASLLSITVVEPGRRRILLPQAVNVVDAISGQRVAEQTTSCECDFQERESRLFLLDMEF